MGSSRYGFISLIARFDQLHDIASFPRFLTKPLLSLPGEEQGEGFSRLGILAELLDDGEPSDLNVFFTTNRFDDLIELVDLLGQRAYLRSPPGSSGVFVVLGGFAESFLLADGLWLGMWEWRVVVIPVSKS